MLYDCFVFFNELDLLELRFNILNDIVDKFVLVESTRTYSNKPKPLYFSENKERFSRFLPKIKHIVLDDFPEYDGSWSVETHNRDAIARGLLDCALDDVILISDVDEIPNPATVLKFKNTNKILSLRQVVFYYYLNSINEKAPYWILGTRILPYREFVGRSASIVRGTDWDDCVDNGGWHFSYLCDPEKIITKVAAFGHQELNLKKLMNVEAIKKKIDQGRDVFNRNFTYKAVKLDDFFPAFIRENKDKYAHFIKQEDEKKLTTVEEVLRRYVRKRKILNLLQFWRKPKADYLF